ncbi:carboxy terminal-processing peptidase [Wenyingzhuangia aestuarii]|uniref:carboxy terminal-processing peptidase n=1 Tax=Wenyingzhuangia aestuarii TaxID=1647582 RepID=UPI00143B82EE|nr:carboxy terminal-processing peptidase [Wenyingzhuangia aestuarii]NJB83799.1 carboxyl-terminal processing protease [Wenyingzhuangia aestuarii]
MKKYIKHLYILTLIVGVSVFYSFKEHQSDKNPEKDQVLMEALRFILEKGHYEPKLIDDTFSEGIFKNFIENLDPYKRYFLASDVAQFKKYYHDIDNQIIRRKFDFYNEVIETFAIRLKESEGLYEDILKNKFDYSVKESINLDAETAEFPINKEEQRNIWRKHLKFSTVNKLNDYLKEEEDKAKEDKNYKAQYFDVLEKKAREKTLDNIKDLFYYEHQTPESDRFAIFLNCITAQFDPHTSYFAPDMKKRFDSSMAGSIEGIGARLSDERGYTKIVELIPGGPAYKQGDLEVGDYIVKVAQGTKGEPTDIVGMRLTDAIELIKGKKGTTVVLTVKKVDNTYKKIAIVRDIVEFEDTFVKSSIAIKDGKKYGIIHLPKFYIDFSKQEQRNSAIDMRIEIEELKKDGIEGLAIDLRNNGGGSLSTAIDIAGLFIEKGPVVQVKYKNNKPDIRNDEDSKIVWNGPLVIMVNELSASASEILAAAMQDYKRAIIIGSKQTYGKGTVQNVIPINQYLNYSEDLGALKLTIQKFYRINGGSTQLKGVSSDIVMPDRYSYLDIAESKLEAPLNWDQIAKATYSNNNYYSNFSQVVSQVQNSISTNKQFNKIDEYAKWLKRNQDHLTYSLNLKTFQSDQEKLNIEAEKYKDILKYNSPYKFVSPGYESKLVQVDTILKDKRSVWHKNLHEDIYVNEALEALSQLKVAQ